LSKNIQYVWKNICSTVNLPTTNLKYITRMRTRSFAPRILYQGEGEEETTQIIYNGFFMLTDALLNISCACHAEITRAEENL